MRKQINEILGKIEDKKLTFGEGANALLLLCNSSLQFKEKKIKDIENWIKSDLAQEENQKLSKTQTPYRIDKIRFLRKIKEILNL